MHILGALFTANRVKKLVQMFLSTKQLRLEEHEWRQPLKSDTLLQSRVVYRQQEDHRNQSAEFTNTKIHTKNTTKWNMSGPVCAPTACGILENYILKTA